MPVLSIILCSQGTAHSNETTDFLMFFLLLYACGPNRVRATADMLIITEIPGKCTLLGNKGDFHASQLKIQKTVVPI